MTATLILTLPVPPSANRLWRYSGRRVHRSARYVAWQKTAGWELQAQRPKAFPPGTSIGIRVKVSLAGRRKDLDNLSKGLLDLMEAHGVIANDRDVSDIRLAWSEDIPAGRVQVEAWAIGKRAA